jgi:predicted MFS family arabinose efflux permease
MVAPMLETLTDAKWVSPANLGLLISVHPAPPILLIPLMGVLADRFCRKTVLVPSVSLFGVAGCAIAFTTSFRVALGLRLMQVIAFSGILPILVVVIREQSTVRGCRRHRTSGSRRPASVRASSRSSSGILFAVVWQFHFLLTAVAIPIAFMLFRWFDILSTDDDDSELDEDQASYLRELLALLERPRVAAILIVCGFQLPFRSPLATTSR